MAATPTPLVRVVRRWSRAPDPSTALAALGERPGAFLRWANGGPADIARWSFAGSEPVSVLEVRGNRRGLSQDPWAAMGARWPRRVRSLGPRIPFAGGWFGSLGYELRAAIEREPPPRRPPDGFPALWLGWYDAVVAWDARTGHAFLAGLGDGVREARDAADRLRERLRAAPASVREPRGAASAARSVTRTTPAAYRRRVADAMERIRDGDLFQANVSQRFEARAPVGPLALFRRLAASSPAPFLTWLHLGHGRAILSASPERFLALRGDLAETRPMKGTRPRGATRASDRRLARELEASVKDRAELAMITDLARNDLGRSCRPGTVRVRCARRLEAYRTVHQAVAIVTGRLERGRTGIDLLRGAFPPGSVTGAPKVEAMRVIDDLEGEARGPYCGAIGWLDAGGDLDLCVAIRTITVGGGRVAYRVGGGVTLLSEPEAERRETLDKGKALARAVAGASP